MKTLYLIAFYYKKPKQPNKSIVKGYINNKENFNYEEKVAFSKKLKNSDISNASVILDLFNQKLIQNNINPSATFSDTLSYYYSNYSDHFKKLGLIVEKNDEPKDVQAVQTEAQAQSQP